MKTSILTSLIIILCYLQITNAGTDYKKRRQMDGVGTRSLLNHFKSYEEIVQHPFGFTLHGLDLDIFYDLLRYFSDGFMDFNKWFEMAI
uniref:Hypotheticial protein n=1 Tax=Schistosoma japonicum TaxID=6182 RepID=C1LDQ5_SCHJA|nr:hypotheticial protein [Schistosoma japonicum]